MARPKQALIDGYLMEIATEYKIQWTPDDIAAAKAALNQLNPEQATEEDSEVRSEFFRVFLLGSRLWRKFER